MNDLNLIRIFLLLLAFVFSNSLEAETEPNDSFETANRESYGSNITGTIMPASDVDYFKVALPRAGTLQASLSNVAANLNLELIIYDASESQIGKAFSNSEGDINFNDIVCDAGDYYFLVKNRPFTGSESNQPYVLSINLIINDIHECNNSFDDATLFELGDDIKGSIGDGNDEDYFKFHASQSGTLHLKVANIHPDLNPELNMYNGLATLVATDNLIEGDSLTIDIIICAGQEYYIQIANKTFYNGFSQDLYTISTEMDLTDIHECNDIFESASSVGLGSHSGTLGDRNDSDFYQFVIPSSGILEASLVNIDDVLKPEIILYDNNQNEITRIRRVNTADSIGFRRFICSENETFYIQVRNQPLFSSYTNSPYQLNLLSIDNDVYECNNSFAEAKRINTDSPIKGSIATDQDEDFFVFNTGDHNTIEIIWSDIPAQIRPRLHIYNEDQTEVGWQGGTAEEGIKIKLTSCTSDDYYIQLKQNVFSSGFSDSLYTLLVNTSYKPPSYEDNTCTAYTENWTNLEDELKEPMVDLREDYHFYTVENTICEMSSGPDCNAEKAWELLKSSGYYMAPSSYDFLSFLNGVPPFKQGFLIFDLMNAEEDLRRPVESCKEIRLFGAAHIANNLGILDGHSLLNFMVNVHPLSSYNPIAFYVNEEEKCITNYTLPGHALHPGKITRCIEGECDEVKVKTYGEGLHFYENTFFGGIMSSINNQTGSFLFNKVDQRFINAFNDLPEEMYTPPVKGNDSNKFENKEWIVEELKVSPHIDNEITVYTMGDSLDYSKMSRVKFELYDNNNMTGNDVNGNTVQTTWWTSGDIISIGHETAQIVDSNDDNFTVSGQIPVFVNDIIKYIPYIMKFVRTPSSADEDIPGDDAYFKLFPNPADDVVHIDLGAEVDPKTKLNLFNALGQKMDVGYTQNNTSHFRQDYSIDLNGLPSGIYFIQLEYRNKISIKSFVKH